ncbi:MAG: hypothetical protein KDK00_09440 [Rhodobacteraceae bacterium]|nr:hypothetical protein [Paracoccaceae bacterium]
MTNQFFTEFPVRNEFQKETLLEQFIVWISGIRGSRLKSNVLRESLKFSRGSDYFGEEKEHLRIACADGVGEKCSGIQYDLPDDRGRIWRTEAVLYEPGAVRYLSIRTACLSDDLSSIIREPKRPVLVKQIIDCANGGTDGKLEVSDIPHYFSTDELEIARDVILGRASFALPVVYVSSQDDDRLPINAEKLAYDLGGLAHVVVEPSRSFSFLLKDETGGRNPYAGAIGLALPGKPISSRLIPSGDENGIREEVIALVRRVFGGKVASRGKEWGELQQMLLRDARKRLSEVEQSGNVDEWIANFEQELQEKQEQIGKLKWENESLRQSVAAHLGESHLSQVLDRLRDMIGELYEGELLDRLRNAVACASSANFAVSDRDIAAMDELVSLIPQSSMSGVKLLELQRASNTGSTNDVISNFLREYGYTRSEKGKHIKFLPPSSFPGLGQVTMAKTPSDHRFGDNMIRDVKKALGLRFHK